MNDLFFERLGTRSKAQVQLTCMLESCAHALVEFASPLPSFKLFFLVRCFQAETLSHHLGGQFIGSPLGFLHQRWEMSISAIQTDNWNTTQRRSLMRLFIYSDQCDFFKLVDNLAFQFNGDMSSHNVLFQTCLV